MTAAAAPVRAAPLAAVPAAARRPRAVIPGIGEPLPAGESLLWTGGPDRAAIARRVCHTRGVVAYFGLLLALAAAGGTTAAGAALLVGMAVTVLAFAHVYAALVARTTVYAVTDRRLVLRIGVAIPAVLNVPLDRVESVDLRLARDGTGDVTITLGDDARVAYLLLWPHARPWRYAHPQPALRWRPDAAARRAAVAEAVRVAPPRREAAP
ncbi:photosynthetic complex putative assembly protein PuhB [Roseisolibacter sp. H3M3-2]|uniref:photosynthetic complex putative assembly protein PuhB n=1 Tax=Roseisolibacter sp. H3M3-2 TaxID=3031323 RepID=UPI0023DAC776|nr:photosynthetic complex putative assembly protein PuhB [Roseisolibacter sp. H3M3-2]MDF1501861.1 photosynthetic complex putative assembly protein PuhB [Roseisolibacter sp. H3M3-2]